MEKGRVLACQCTLRGSNLCTRSQLRLGQNSLKVVDEHFLNLTITVLTSTLRGQIQPGL
jgi:hypothetical protein